MSDDTLLRILAEALRANPGLLSQAAALAGGTLAQGDTIRALWTTWEPHARSRYASPLATAARMLEVELPTASGPRRLGEWPVAEFGRSTCDLYRAARTKMVSQRGQAVSDTTVDRELTALQGMISWHVQEGRLEKNPIAGWKRSRARRRQTMLSWEQFKAFASHAAPWYQDVVRVMYKCAGMRRGEVLGLRKTELDHARQEIVLQGERTKTDRDRVIPVDIDTWELIERRAAESEGPFVFVDPGDPNRCRPLSPRQVYLATVKCRKASGMVGVHGEPIVPHLARHGGINDLLLAGVNPADVSAAAGVSLAIMQKHYLHFSPPRRDQMAEKINAYRAGRKPPMAVRPPPKAKNISR